MNIESQQVNKKWTLFKLKNDHGMEVHILNFGGIITRINVPDKFGIMENVVLGYENIKEYETNSSFFGAIIGRVAGRIKEASFQIDENLYQLDANNGENCLHSGPNGFHQVIWDSDPYMTETEVGLKLHYFSKNGENGFPGNVDVNVTYTINNHNQLAVNYSATTDQTTALTLTNHSYFNLSGDIKDTIHDHYLTINSHQFAELNDELIPTGTIVDSQNTPFDFRQERKLKDGISFGSIQNQIVGNGYDHYFLFDSHHFGNINLKDRKSGRQLNIQTDQPGMVMYTANHLGEGVELIGGMSRKYLGICFETQGSPASLHHEGFPSIILRPGELYRKQTVFSFCLEI